MYPHFKTTDCPRDQPFGCFYRTTHDPPAPPPNYIRGLDAYPTLYQPPSKLPSNVQKSPKSMSEDKDALARADSIIDGLMKQLPHYPLLLTPHPDAPLLKTSRTIWENEGLPFEAYELGRGQQYMTLIAEPQNRGTTFTRGGWEEEDLSPASANDFRSRTATPDPNKPRVKMSLADYKKAPKKTTEEIEKAKALQATRRKEEQEKMSKKKDSDYKKRDAELQALAQASADLHVQRKKDAKLKEKNDAFEKKLEQGRTTPGFDRSAFDEHDADRLERRSKEDERQKREDELERKEALRALKAEHDRAQAQKAKEQALRHASKESADPRKPVKKLPPMLSPLPAHLEDDNDAERLPRLLSPTLPAEVEEALAGLKPKDEVKHSDRTIEARRERTRRPDAPGVARKMAKVKRKATPESDDEEVEMEPPKKIVKLKYGKVNRKTVERMLHMKPRPGQERKRPREAAEDVIEHAPKRTKAPLSSIPSKPSAPPPIPSHRAMLGTPKKGEAMARVSSTDSHSHARTPQGPLHTPRPIPTSTPSTVDKPRSNGVITAPKPAVVETMESLKADFPRYQTIGTTLKRSMDTILQTKSKDVVKPVISTPDQKLAAIIGVECASAYMLGFSAFDKTRKHERKFNGGENWEQLLALLPFILHVCKPFPELSIAAQLACAVSREVLGGLYIERLAAETGALDAKFKDAIVRNGRERALSWEMYATEAASAGKTLVHVSTSIRDTVDVLIASAEAFAGTNGIAWEKKIDV